ncbi:hypothetical protein, partial [Rhizobium leguminosarum]|uniref:hypothetical protein n=1 Tax=Rhizobium leguminosarum TaxID=384 RepID=UPI003F9A28F8
SSISSAYMAIWLSGDCRSCEAVAMVFGILVAGASSIFIAAPIQLFLGDWRRRHARAAPAADEAVEINPPEQGRPRKSAS